MKKIFTILLILLLSATICNALGVSPASVKINFEPNLIVHKTLFVVNDENEAYNVSLSLDGELKNFAALETDLMQVNPGFNSFNLTISLPQDLEPGARLLLIRVTPGIITEEGGLVAYVSMAMPVYVKVPYPNKYATSTVFIVPGVEGGITSVYVDYDNLGSEDINDARAFIKIFSNSNLLKEVNTSNIAVPKASLGKVFGQVFLKNGRYAAVVDSVYDDNHVALYSNFTIGSPKIAVLKKDTTLIYGQVNKFSFIARNDWNEPLTISGYVTSEGKRTYLNSFVLDPTKTRKIQAYFDATDLSEGEHDMKIVFEFNEFSNITSEHDFTAMFVSKKEFDKKAFMKQLPLIIIVVVLMIIMTLLVFFYLKKKNKKMKEDSKSSQQDLLEEKNQNIGEKEVGSDDKGSETFK